MNSKLKRILALAALLMAVPAAAQKVDLTRMVTGVLPQANGGTGATSTPSIGTLVADCILYGTGSASIACANLTGYVKANGASPPTGVVLIPWTDIAIPTAPGISGIKNPTALVWSATAPTLASGGCTTPTAVTHNGTAAFSVGVGTGCTGSQPLVFTLPAATTGWSCTARSAGNANSHAPRQTSAVSTTSVTITDFSATAGTAQAWVDSDVVVVACTGY